MSYVFLIITFTAFFHSQLRCVATSLEDIDVLPLELVPHHTLYRLYIVRVRVRKCGHYDEKAHLPVHYGEVKKNPTTQLDYSQQRQNGWWSVAVPQPQAPTSSAASLRNTAVG